MKILYLDLGMGAAGDMLAGALLGLLDDGARADFLRQLNGYLPAGVEASVAPAAQCGVTGLRFCVRVHGAEEQPGEPHHHHAHAGLMEIGETVAAMGLEADAAEAVMAVYDAIAAAESEVHNVPVTELHFHELGALDAVADITATVLLLRLLAPERIAASPVAVGSGLVRCAHGLLPVPAPATALLLRGVPALAGELRGELCTPTGAALVRRFVRDFGPMPAMTAQRVGYGFGTKEFPERPNCVRAVLGEAFEEESSLSVSPAGCQLPQGGSREEIVELQCNLDDMTPEDVGFALERVYDAGAVEAFTLPAGMKKNRPGVLLTALCRAEDRDAVLAAIFTHTSTLGVRECVKTRHVLARETETVPTVFGPVRRKVAGGARAKWEYEDLARIARAEDMPLQAVREVLDSDGSAD